MTDRIKWIDYTINQFENKPENYLLMTKYNLGDSISGERIIGWAGAIDKRGNIKKNNILLKKLRFRQGAECIVDLPIISNKSSSSNDTEASNNNTEEGLIGSKITVNGNVGISVGLMAKNSEIYIKCAFESLADNIGEGTEIYQEKDGKQVKIYP